MPTIYGGNGTAPFQFGTALLRFPDHLAALPLALYVGSAEVLVLYRSPHWLWLPGAVHIYGLSRLWLLANRRDVNEDPVIFALRDPATYALLLLSCGILALSI